MCGRSEGRREKTCLRLGWWYVVSAMEEVDQNGLCWSTAFEVGTHRCAEFVAQSPSPVRWSERMRRSVLLDFSRRQRERRGHVCSCFQSIIAIRKAMSGKYVFSKAIKEVRFHLCQTSEHSNALRYVMSWMGVSAIETL